MATQEVIDFHRQGTEISNRRLLNKITYDEGKGVRRAAPQFRGLVPNSTGSRNTMFFTHNNQSNQPFSVPVPVPGMQSVAGAGNAGALWNPAGRKYAKAVLQRRAMDLLAQQEMLPEQMALPGQAAADEMPLTAAEAEKDQLRSILQTLIVSFTASKSAGVDYTGLIQRAALLLTKVGPYLEVDELEELDELLGDIQNLYETEAAKDALNTPGFGIMSQKSIQASFNTMVTIVISMRQFVSKMLQAPPSLTEKERKMFATTAKKDAGIGRSIKRATPAVATAATAVVRGAIPRAAAARARAARRPGGPPPPPRGPQPPPGGPPPGRPPRGPQARRVANYDQQVRDTAQRVNADARQQAQLRAQPPVQLQIAQEDVDRMNELSRMIDAAEQNVRDTAFSGREAAQAMAQRLAARIDADRAARQARTAARTATRR